MRVFALTVFVFVAVCAQLAVADEQGMSPRGRGHNVAQKKAEILQYIEERIANSKLEMTCVQSAQSHDELKACREKYRPQHKNNRGENNRQPWPDH
jgi:hypothetical protein